MVKLEEALPILHAGHPICYRGRLAAVAANGEVYSVGWADSADRLVVRAMAVAVFEAPQLDSDGQFSFASYYLLPDEVWGEVERWPDELIERTVGVPQDLIRRRRSLPSLGPKTATHATEPVCA